MSIIRLTPKQKKTVPVNLGFKYPKLPANEIPAIVALHLAGDKYATERLINENSYLVSIVVGRFIKYWPQTKRHKDQMISEGLLSLTKTVNNILPDDSPTWLVGRLLANIKYAIEKYLNENIAAVTASYRTNQRRRAEGKPIESHAGTQLAEGMVGSDDSYAQFVVQLQDLLEAMHESDSEEVFDRILWFLEEEHNISSLSLSQSELATIRELTRIVTGD